MRELHLSQRDIEAILAALPLIPFLTDDPITNQINFNISAGTAEKLAYHKRLSASDIRIIACAVYGAYDYLSGIRYGITNEIDTGIKADLAPYLFDYNRLRQDLDRYI